MSFSTGSFRAWSKEGAKYVGIPGVNGSRSNLMRASRAEGSNVKAAPRRACAVSGSGIAES